jgi:predicted ABC-type ATPase
MSVKPRILIIAGPNGAGKTTFAREFLPAESERPIFVNADLIAAGLSPFDPSAAAMRAGRVMLEEIERHVRNRESFGIETTLSGNGYARLIPRWRQLGYRVELIFLALDDAEAAIARVAERVKQGGHDIPEPVIRRRFVSGRRNFEMVYRALVNSWMLYDNNGESPVLLEFGENP